MNKYKANGHYSQFGEEGIINEVIRRLDLLPGIAIEFGAPTKTFCSNIYHLKFQGWKLLYYDMNPQEDGITRLTVTPENVNDMPRASIWSCDCDGPDAGIFAALDYLPDLVIIEINSSLDPEVDYFGEKGANYSYMKKLGESKGFMLLAHTGNLIFTPECFRSYFPDADETFDNSWR